MIIKSNLIKFTILTVLTLSFFYIFNFATDKKDALANINNKQIVEVFKTPTCGCCYGYVLFLEIFFIKGFASSIFLDFNKIDILFAFW